MRGSEIGTVGEGEDRKRGKIKNIVKGTTKPRVQTALIKLNKKLFNFNKKTFQMQKAFINLSTISVELQHSACCQVAKSC